MTQPVSPSDANADRDSGAESPRAHDVASRLAACTTPTGILAAAALDQRGSLRKGLEKAGAARVDEAALSEFKTAVAEALTPHASAILLDPVVGLDAAARRASGCGLILAYEKSGYDASDEGRQPDLLDGWSVRRLLDAGADAVKLLVYWDPAAPSDVNDRKRAFVERVGAECVAEGAPFFLEPVTYAQGVADPLELAKGKPERVRATAAEFSADRYRVSVLKVEIPVEARFVAGLSRAARATGAADGSHASSATAYDLDEARRAFRAAAEAATKPFIYLSAGVDMDVYLELLELAGDAGAEFAGVLCGRATWKGGMAAYASGGVDALRRWLEDEGVPNIERLNRVLRIHARPLPGLVGSQPSPGRLEP